MCNGDDKIGQLWPMVVHVSNVNRHGHCGAELTTKWKSTKIKSTHKNVLDSQSFFDFLRFKNKVQRFRSRFKNKKETGFDGYGYYKVNICPI